MRTILVRLFIVIFSFILVTLTYQTAPIRFFSFDILKKISASSFRLFKIHGGVDERVILLNAGTKTPEQINAYIKLIKRKHPTSIGINLCHLTNGATMIKEQYKNDKHVVFADCSQPSHGLGRIINNDNSVTHFQSDYRESFERQLLLYSPPSVSKSERINYSKWPSFYETELDSQKFLSDLFTGSIVLIGYLGDYIVGSDESIFEKRELQYFTNARITPMNKFYLEQDAIPDMYDTEISAHILVSLLDNNFIKDISKLTSVILMLAIIIVQSLILNMVQQKHILINIGVALLYYFFIKFTCGALIIYLFTQGYYLELNELLLLLGVVIAFNLGFTVFKKRKFNTLS